jgi:hypothetical protein
MQLYQFFVLQQGNFDTLGSGINNKFFVHYSLHK